MFSKEVIMELDKMSMQEVIGTVVKSGDCVIYSYDRTPCEVVKVEDGKIFIDRGYGDPRSYSFEEFKSEYTVTGYTYAYIEKQATMLQNGGLTLKDFDEDSLGGPSDVTALQRVDKQMYIDYLDVLKEKRIIADATSALIKQKLELKMRQLGALTDKFKKKIEKLKKIVWTIELYLGLKEEVEHVNIGESASDETPIVLCQDMLYMDEEVGDPTDGGYDITNLEDFKDWLRTKSTYHQKPNYELLCPFEKSVRLLRVRRKKKNRDHISCIFTKISLEVGDMETFMLIRNGSNLYMIATNMHFGEKLFPGQSEIMDMYARLKDRDDWQIRSEEDIENQVDIYKRNMVVMQGLADRTDVLGDLEGKINILNDSAVKKGQVEFFYDADFTALSDGEESVWDWYNRAKECSEGDRILYLGGLIRGEDLPSHFFKNYYKSAWSCPKRPPMGIYTLKHTKKKWYADGFYLQPGHPYIMYLPESQHYWYEDEKRKRRVSFDVKHLDYINFDSLTFEDMEKAWHFMHDRRYRRSYLSIMRAIQHIYEYKKAEIVKETPFCKMIMASCSIEEREARALIDWWKTKNKWKRALSVDDNKATRMIIKRHKSNIKHDRSN